MISSGRFSDGIAAASLRSLSPVRRDILFCDDGEITKKKVVFTLSISESDLLEICVIHLRKRRWRKI